MLKGNENVGFKSSPVNSPGYIVLIISALRRYEHGRIRLLIRITHLTCPATRTHKHSRTQTRCIDADTYIYVHNTRRLEGECVCTG